MGELARIDEPQDKLLISDEALTTIAALAMSRVRLAVPCGQSGGDGIAGFFGMRSASKGVKIETIDDGTSVVVDLSVNVEYGARICEIARELQEAVRHDIEDMTGMKAAQVNVHVLGLLYAETKGEASQA